jgi:hypothetical protein
MAFQRTENMSIRRKGETMSKKYPRARTRTAARKWGKYERWLSYERDSLSVGDEADAEYCANKAGDYYWRIPKYLRDRLYR